MQHSTMQLPRAIVQRVAGCCATGLGKNGLSCWDDNFSAVSVSGLHRVALCDADYIVHCVFAAVARIACLSGTTLLWLH